MNIKTDAEFHTRENVTYSMKDKDGNIVPLFQDNAVNRAIFSFFRRFTKPLTADGQVKKGVLNYLAAYGLRINYLTGIWKNEVQFANLITSAGKAALASRVNGSGGENPFTYIALGIGTTAANAADTALQSEIVDSGLERASATVSRVTTSVTNDTARLTYTWTASGTKAVTESGCLNAAVAGVLLNRQVFSAVNLVNGNSFQATHDIAIS